MEWCNRDGWWATTGRVSRQAKYGRPPLYPGSLQPSVPSWERKFCTSVGRIPWKRLCEAQSFMHLYPNVIEWDDSAGREAFWLAKARFFAEVNGLPHNIPLPDPDLYIDVVDYDAVIDPELVEDLYRQPPAPADGESDLSIKWDSFIFANKPVPATGWDDAEDPPPTKAISLDPQTVIIQPTGWGDAEDSNPTNEPIAEPHSVMWGTNADSVNAVNSVTDTYAYYGNFWNCSNGWGDRVVQYNSWASRGRYQSWAYGWKNSCGQWESRKTGQNRRHTKKRNGGAHFAVKHANWCNEGKDNKMKDNGEIAEVG